LLLQKVDLLKRRVFGSSGAKLDSAQLKNIFAQSFSGFFTPPFISRAQFGTAQVQHRLSTLPMPPLRRQSLVVPGSIVLRQEKVPFSKRLLSTLISQAPELRVRTKEAGP